jgi:hypothetical protein
MKCPKCHNTGNRDGDYYCHNCGRQLKTRIKIWWFGVPAFAVAIIFAIVCYEYYYDKFESQSSRENQLYLENKQLNNEIANLKAQLPQSYYTRYSNQYLYNKCASEYEQAKCYLQHRGTMVIIYKQEDGYGLTNLGSWIPMRRLVKDHTAK